MNSDFKDLLRVFNEFEVKYLVVGGYAVIQYSEPRYTKDLDIWVAATPQNAEKIYGALKFFGAPLFDLTAEDFSEEGFFFMI